MEEFLTAHFWVAVGQIILIDILLGGDNAVVIALACRQLPENQRLKGVIWGTVGAILLRMALIAFAITLLQVPFLKIAGAALLIWIGVKLITPHDEDAHGNIQASDKLWSAVKTVIVADLVMSIENGEYKVVEGLEIDSFSQERINKTLAELQGEQEGVKHLL